MKLVWNSPPDAEMVYDTVFAELRTRLVYESVDYVSKVLILMMRFRLLLLLVLL